MEWKSLQRYWIREWENTQEEDFSFDFGVIKKDYSLVSNTFPLPIPKKDYSVCRLLANLSTNVSGGTHGGHNSGTGSHSHKVVMPK